MDEFNKLAWEMFKKSGSISNYLIYSATKPHDNLSETNNGNDLL